MAAFYYGLLFLGRKCLHATSQKRALSHAITLAVNYRLFSHGDVSYRFNEKNDNVVLEYHTSHEFPMLKLHRPEGEKSYYHPAIISTITCAALMRVQFVSERRFISITALSTHVFHHIFS